MIGRHVQIERLETAVPESNCFMRKFSSKQQPEQGPTGGSIQLKDKQPFRNTACSWRVGTMTLATPAERQWGTLIPAPIHEA